MKTINLAIVFLFAAILAACSSINTPTTPAQTIYQAESDYNAAATIVVAYKALPLCAPASPPLCSKADVVDKLKQADTVAYNALVAAENVARTPGAGANAATAQLAAQQAIAALTTITATLAVK